MTAPLCPSDALATREAKAAVWAARAIPPAPVVAPAPAPVALIPPALRDLAARIAADISAPPRPLVDALMQHLDRLPADPGFGAEGDLRLLVETAQGIPVGVIAGRYGQSAAAGAQRLRRLFPPAILDRHGAVTLAGRAALLEAAKRRVEAGHA